MASSAWEHRLLGIRNSSDNQKGTLPVLLLIFTLSVCVGGFGVSSKCLYLVTHQDHHLAGYDFYPVIVLYPSWSLNIFQCRLHLGYSPFQLSNTTPYMARHGSSPDTACQENLQESSQTTTASTNRRNSRQKVWN